MESKNNQRCQTALYDEEEVLTRPNSFANAQGSSCMNQQRPNSYDSPEGKILQQLHDQQLLIVNPRRRNGLILFKRYHAEFAGPGSGVGGLFDLDCQRVLPVGNISLLSPESSEERQRAYLIRRQWVRLTMQITDNPAPTQRAQNILQQFEGFFDTETIASLPHEAFALLVGVLPYTVIKVRQTA